MSDHTAPIVTRRKLLKTGAAFACAAALPATTALAMAKRPNVNAAPGIQLYTVRDSMQENLPATLDAVAAIGFRDVEFAGYFERSPNALRQMLDARGLRSSSSHVNARALRDNPQAIVDAAAAIGNRFVTIGWLEQDDRRSADDYKRWADALNRAGELAAKAGLQAAYHNHEFEFEAFGDTVPYDVLLANTEPELVAFELDFFWVRKAGLQVEDVLGKAPKRFRLAHIKDMDDAGNMVDVGCGQISFARILKSPVAASLEHFFVEHDQPTHPFRTAAVGRRALSEILLQR
ncbi:MAG: sugar phosphate isomerase/epimerase family protein [Gammaproteobacteria bacterium]